MPSGASGSSGKTATPLVARRLFRLTDSVSVDDETCQTFAFDGEGHTFGNALRWVIIQNPIVKFCGYSMPHPSEQKFHLRIETYGGHSATDVLLKGIRDLKETYVHVKKVFEAEIQSKTEGAAGGASSATA